MSTRTRPVGPALVTLARAALAVLAAAIVWSAGIWLLRLDWYAGPSAQRVNIRWAPDAAADPRKRAIAEDALGLTAGEQEDPGSRTWSYRLADRSPENIGRILSNPSVEDTHWIDRARLRVELNQPGLPAWLRDVLQTGWASPLALLFLIAGAVPVWVSRLQIGAAPRQLRHVVGTTRHVVRAAAAPVAARIRAVFVMPAGTEPRPPVPGLQWSEVAAGLAMGLVLLAPLLTYGPADDEEVGLGVFSSQVLYQALFTGHWSFWLNDLGFGTPMPIGQRLDFHPVFALGSLVSVWTALCAVWIVHVAVMVVYFLRLAVASGIRPPLRTILLGCYVFSMPAVFYFYETDWVSVIVAWSLLPVITFYLRRAALDPGRESAAISAARLGLLGAFWFLNSHPGYLVTLAFAVAIYTLVLAPLRLRVYGCLLSAVVLAAAASAERLWFSLSEMRRFPSALLRATQEGYTLAQYAWGAIVPVTETPLKLRGPFVGMVLGLAALSVVLRVTRESDRHVRACGIAFAVATALSMASQDMLAPLRVFSAAWLFRDSMVFFALLAGGVALQRALDSLRPLFRAVVWCCVLAQVAQQATAVWPGFRNISQSAGRMQHYRHQHQPVGIGALIRQRAASYGSRLYVSEELRGRLRGRLSGEGLHFITDLAFLGVNPINVSFKNVSMDRLYPSSALMSGLVGGQQDVIENDALLDVLGVNLVMMAAGEGPIPSTLRLTDRLRPPGGVTYDGPAHDILVLANENAWPKAVLIDSAAQALSPPFRPGCPHRGALCRDYTALAATRLPEPVRLASMNSRYVARFAPSDRERRLFLSVLYRPEWRATAPTGALQVVPVADAFVSVTVPPGVEEVDLRFVPRMRIALAWFSSGVLTILLVVVGWGQARRRTVLATFNRLPLWRWRVRVWGFRLRAPTFDRCLYLWMHRLGRMGRDDQAFLEASIRPGMRIADVGANIGLYTLLLARLAGPAGRIHAFEPDPLMVGFLRQNLAAAGASTVEVFPCAAGAASGEEILQRHAINSGDNRLGPASGGAWHGESHAVPVRALDEALDGQPLDLVKIDVQGWEAEVFRGLGKLLDANPGLRIYFEFWPDGLAGAGTSVAALATLLDELRLRTTLPGGSEPVDLVRLAAGMRPGAYTNLLAARPSFSL